MNASPSAAAAVYGFLALAQGAVIDATSLRASPQPDSRAAQYGRRFSVEGSWGGVSATRSATAGSDRAMIVVNDRRPSDRLIAVLAEFLALHQGWDGEDAHAPSSTAVLDAIRFINAAGMRALALEPSLHVDGSVLLEIEDGAAGSLRFTGDGSIVYAIKGVGTGSAVFDGYTIPEEVGAALSV